MLDAMGSKVHLSVCSHRLRSLATIALYQNDQVVMHSVMEPSCCCPAHSSRPLARSGDRKLQLFLRSMLEQMGSSNSCPGYRRQSHRRSTAAQRPDVHFVMRSATVSGHLYPWYGYLSLARSGSVQRRASRCYTPGVTRSVPLRSE